MSHSSDRPSDIEPDSPTQEQIAQVDQAEIPAGKHLVLWDGD